MLWGSSIYLFKTPAYIPAPWKDDNDSCEAHERCVPGRHPKHILTFCSAYRNLGHGEKPNVGFCIKFGRDGIHSWSQTFYILFL